MYKLAKNSLNQIVVVLNNNDGSTTSFFADVDGPEQRTYLAWLAEGNTPTPADEQGAA